MGTRLFPIALDLLAPTLVAGSSHPAPLLHLLGIGDGGLVRGIIMIMVVEMRIIVFRGKTSKILAVKRTGGSSHGAQRTGQEEEDSFNSICMRMRYLDGYKEEGRARAPSWRSGRIDIHERDSRLSQVHGS